MSNTVRDTTEALAELFVGEQQGQKILHQAAIADFAKKHRICGDFLPVLHQVLESVSQAYWLEVSRTRRDKGSIRRELNALLDW